MKLYTINLLFSLLILLPWTSVLGQDTTNIFQATLGEIDAPTPNISTEELQQILAEGSALVLDSRSFPEWATGHIPGAIVLAAKPDQVASEYVSDIAEVERLTNGDKDAAIVLYCNGPFCGKSKRLSGELKDAGYTNVRRYQLGAPVWRALGNPMVIEPPGIQYVLGDNTAYWVDARDPSEVAVMGSLTSVAHLINVPSGTVTQAKDEKRLPMHDYNTRIIVFGAFGEQAQQLAQELTQGAFHNVAYFSGSYDEFLAVVAGAASNEGVVRRAYQAFAQGDVPTFLSLLDTNVEWVEPEGVPFAGTYVGPDAVLNDVLIPITSQWDGFTVTPETFMDAGDEITVLGTISGTNKATGKMLETPYIAVWTLRDGKVVKYQPFVNTLAFIEATTSVQSNAEIGERFVAIFNEQDPSIADDIFAPNFVAHVTGSPTATLDKAGWKAYLESFRASFPDLHLEVKDMITTEDKVILRVVLHGTQTGAFQNLSPSGKAVAFDGVAIHRIENGQSVEHWGVMDLLSLMQQLSSDPEATQ